MVLIACDLALDPPHSDLARVTACVDGTVHAYGQYKYKEPVPEHFATRLQVGDTLDLRLTRFFYEWNEATLLRDGIVVAVARGEDLTAMGIVGGWVFLASILVFLPRRTLSKHKVLRRVLYGWMVLSVIASGIVWSVEILMWMGYSQPPPGG